MPFPCQDKPCGCRDAASCWKSCCCNTNKQKVAWAKKHGVTPPAFVVAAAKAEDGEPRGTCCLMSAKPAKKEVNRAAQTAETTTAIVLLDSYRKCQGLEALWNILAQAVVPERQSPLLGPPSPSIWLTVFSESATQLSERPALRPPRV